MKGRIESGQLVTLAPIASQTVAVGDVVLVRWKGNDLLHLVKAIDDSRHLIGNNLDKIDGWVPAEALCAKVIAVEDQE